MSNTKNEGYNWFIDSIKDQFIQDQLKRFINFSERELKWYTKRVKLKSSLSNWIIFLTVILFSLSLLLVVLGKEYEILSVNNYMLGYICLLVASTLVMLDRIFGHSSGWIRFLTTKLELERLISEYYSLWGLQITNLDTENLTKEDKVNLIKLIGYFDSGVRQVIIKEISAWKFTFTEQLESLRKDIDKNLAKTKGDITKFSMIGESLNYKQNNIKEPGILTLSFKKPEGTKIEIEIEKDEFIENKTLPESQSSVMFSGLKQGIYKLRCKLKNTSDNEVVKIVEKAVDVLPETTVNEDIDLITEV